MNRDKATQFGLSMGIIIAGLLTFIFFGIYYYLPKLNQRVDTLAARMDATTTIAPNNSVDEKLTGLGPRMADLEKNYSTLVSVINTKMPNVNLPALLAIENEPMQAKSYLSSTLAFNDNEVTQVMGPMDKYEKSKFMGFKFLHRSH
jgi:hypothetical protein